MSGRIAATRCQTSPFPAIGSPLLKRLYADWQARRLGRSMPARENFDPLDLRYILGKLLLIDVVQQPLQFRFRLVGSDLVQRSGVGLTGKTLDNYPDPEYREFMRRRYTAAVVGRHPLSSIQTRLVVDNRIRRCEALLLPLAGDGETVDMLMIGIVYL